MNKKPTTIKGWLKWAKANDCEWAQAALEQIDSDFHCGRIVPNLGQAVMHFACWSATSEGGGFWQKAYDEAKNIKWGSPNKPKKKMTVQKWRTKKPTAVKGWLEWAKAAGYEWAVAALEQMSNRGRNSARNLCDAVHTFSGWGDTKEGASYWVGIHGESEKIEWRAIPVKVKFKKRAIPIGCLTFDEFVDATVIDFLDEFTEKWDADATQLRMFTPEEKGFTFELRDQCMLRAMNALNDAEYSAEVISVQTDGCYTKRTRKGKEYESANATKGSYIVS